MSEIINRRRRHLVGLAAATFAAAGSAAWDRCAVNPGQIARRIPSHEMTARSRRSSKSKRDC